MIRDESGLTEATITINGRQLTVGESMAVRAAVTGMRMSVCSKEGRKALGRKMAEGYDYHLKRVEDKIIRDIERKS